jgi:glycosyltransferase involved in cell wall biosynthesis
VKFLLLHQNFPGQYSHIAALARSNPKMSVVAITAANNKRPDLIQTVRYDVKETMPASLAAPVKRFGEAILRAEGAAKAAMVLKTKGYYPDIILGHAAWGETFYVREVFPDAKVVTYAEFYYRSQGLNTGFDPEFDPGGPDIIRTIDSQNAVMQMALHTADFGYCPTLFQASTFPRELQQKIGIIFDGVDTDVIRPNPTAEFALPNGKILRAGDPVITFINRNFEPYRGYHTFMRALPKVLVDNPTAHILMVGGDGVSYGPPAPKGTSWKDIFLKEVDSKIDLSRVHFLGRVPHETLRTLYQISAAHVYLTYPFVLSWSMLEAMSAGCLVIGSDVKPVQEIIRHGENGLLTSFFDTDALAQEISRALKEPKQFEGLRATARLDVIRRYDLRTLCLPAQLDLYGRIVRNEGLGPYAANLQLAQSGYSHE